MATIKTTGSNGVSYGAIHEVTTQDATDSEVIIDFQVNLPLVAIVQIVNASGIVVDLADAVITYPADGQISIADGAATYATTATDVISVVAQYARIV